MSKHTPGPWSTNGLNFGAATIKHPSWENSSHPIARAYQRLVGYDEHGNHTFDKEEAESNACLIAAAPDLLHSLIEMQLAFGDFCCDNGISHEDMERDHPEMLAASMLADEAIKKARGEA